MSDPSSASDSSQLRDQINELTEDCQKLRADRADSAEKLGAIKDQLETSQTELAKTQSELRSSENQLRELQQQSSETGEEVSQRKRTMSEDSGNSNSSNDSTGSSDEIKSNQPGNDDSTVANSILIVEDFSLTSKFLSTTLRYCRSAECTTCSDGVKALTKIEEHGVFDLILTDIMMDPMSGIEFITRVRAMEAAKGWKPQIILAMSADEDKSEEALAAGASIFMDKYSSPMAKIFSILDDLRIQSNTINTLLQDPGVEEMRRHTIE